VSREGEDGKACAQELRTQIDWPEKNRYCQVGKVGEKRSNRTSDSNQRERQPLNNTINVAGYKHLAANGGKESLREA